MTPWEVIQEALLHRRPIRNLQWLAEQLGVSIQAVVNWRARGVPANRYRDIAAALGITEGAVESRLVRALRTLVKAQERQVRRVSEEGRENGRRGRS